MYKSKLSLLMENISLMNTKSHNIKHDYADMESRSLSPKTILDATNNHQGNGNMIPNSLLTLHDLDSTVKGITVPKDSNCSWFSSVPLIEPVLETQIHIESKRTSSATEDQSTQSFDDEPNENIPVSKLHSECSSISGEMSLQSTNSNIFNNSKIISFSDENIFVFHRSNRTPQICVKAVDENVSEQSLNDNSCTSKPSSHSPVSETEYQSDFESVISSSENDKNRFPKLVKNIPTASSLTDKIEDRNSKESIQKCNISLDQLKHFKRFTSDQNNYFYCCTNSVGVQTEENIILPKLKPFDNDEVAKQAYKPMGVPNHFRMKKSFQEKHRYLSGRSRMRCPVVKPVDLIKGAEKSNLSRGRLNFSGGMLVEQALDEMLRQQISLTRHFIESHHKMYINYCKAVRDMNLDYRRL